MTATQVRTSSPLRDYQADAAIKAFKAISDYGGYYIQHPPGAGKSLTAIATARLLKAEVIVIVCPVVAIGVWHREFQKWWPGRTFNPTVINYDKLINDKTLKEICALRPDLLIVDEGQYVKSPSAHRTRAIWRLADYSAGVLYLSGTPAHSPLDWWAQYRVVARNEPAFKMNYSTYRNQLAVMGGPTGNWPTKDKNGQLKVRPDVYCAVAQAMEPYTHLAPDALDDLDEPVEQEIPFQLDDREQVAYDKMEEVLRVEFEEMKETQAEIVLTKMLRLSQISAGHVTLTTGQVYDLGYSRLEALLDLLEQHSDEKVVIACRFSEDIRRITHRLKAAGRACSFIDGTVTGATRTNREDWFQQIDEPAVMVLQYQAGGVAITLTAAKVLVFYTLDYSVIRYRQMIGRIWRIGQRGRCVLYTIVGEGTNDGLALGGLRHGYDQVNLAKILLSRLNDGR